MPQFKVIISGTVQGVGFRPFVYRTAKKNNIKGYIKNSGNSVELLLDGDERKIRSFLDIIKKDGPPLSRIVNMEIRPCKESKFIDFIILKSENQGMSDSIMPPDVTICDACLNDVFDRMNRRYQFPFTVCTDCGARFTILGSLPYDRENTSMSEFNMCKSCKKEYLDPLDRRFRAEPISCPDCGPHYELFRGSENTFSKNPIRDAAQALDSGKILAIKGVGGTHLVTGTRHDDALLRMRLILKRPWKPFAIMAKNIAQAHRIAFISEKEEHLLTSIERPILLLSKRNSTYDKISPGLDTIGIMLPYSGLHHLLFNVSNEPALVMTSANPPGEPMALNTREILSMAADFSLIHNREIKNRCDDSVIKLIQNSPAFIRRSRGFVPTHIEVKGAHGTVLSLGAELDVTACILKKNKAFLTQYIGNTTKLRTLEYLETAVYNLMILTGVEKVDAVAVDKHPSFNTSVLGEKLSRKFDAPLVKCQHHFAHAASLLAEGSIERMVCITADGVGFGNDGTSWGGEIILVDNGFERAGHLVPQLMPGGDLAARYPARMAAGILSKKINQDELSKIFTPYFGKNDLDIILRQIETGFNSPLTSSTGRILDAVAALLGVCMERTYEGEPAVKLEAFSRKGRDVIDMPVRIQKRDGKYIFDTTGLIEAVYLARDNRRLPDIAASAQSAVAAGLCEMAMKVARDRQIEVIGFSGGVGYNEAIIMKARNMALEEGFEFVTHTKVPCGDGGISPGQALIGSRMSNLDI
jgi:hydrogenase maturation protein HypF